MRIVSFGGPGGEQPGVLVDDHTILPLAPVLAPLGLPATDTTHILALWPAVRPLVEAALHDTRHHIARADVRLGPPVPRPGKVIAVGFNYPMHSNAVLGPVAAPTEPVLFLKLPGSVCGPYDPLIKPPETTALDYEIELAVVIGRAGRRIAPADAHAHVAGYMIANDVTARDVALGAGIHSPLQMQLVRGKGFPSFCATGPWLLTRDERDEQLDSEPLRLRLSVNGEARQDGWSSDMLFDVPALIASISNSMDLLPGDVILTGTPSGCGFELDPPAYLVEGDEIRGSITGLGELHQRVTDEDITQYKTPATTSTIRTLT
ncbi:MULTISPECIES: fumarylacetoacetate hydrolase family protein [Streptomyces]|uniref:fumarylacetoacetate hydrolase family protein n=1 Tax=Streptomyces TaxID=1883 RepID=UPI001A93B823|nr:MULTISPECIES: fumarylacetoacetate hydrolase family protein [Streptomyces]MBO0914027.1 fumarylacetoacetate hydrolase family protein [Streptomyces laculatispora]MCX4398677.1 fumarylacetoacetate hydrolase family protein [Streptomyces sp. NBC_01767]MCX4768143.1 fumarylacetoacetate hydrolase family protein [Streptomyces sp. NBC_01285]WSP50978.1 fumarylacetoacetate hydrolase family protein [Streptomyces sp. NBC_01243]